MKTCSKCGVEKSATDFYAGKCVCKVCYDSRAKKNREANRDRYRQYYSYENRKEYFADYRKRKKAEQ